MTAGAPQSGAGLDSSEDPLRRNGVKPGFGTQQHKESVWTAEAVLGLGLTTDIETAASILGISRTKAYALASSGEFPVRLIRAGRRYLVPVPVLLGLLGIDKPQA
jgi:hypothetical protein